MSSISVLGLGAMGSRIAMNYLRSGHLVTVWNRTSSVADHFASGRPADSALRVAATAREAVDGADVVVCMVTDDDAARSVWLDPDHGVLDAMASGALAIESSTLTAATSRALATHAAAAGVRFVEAPVVGSRPQAESGALFYLLAGDTDAIERAQPIIDINAGGSTRVGAVGNAATLKLAINGLFAAQVAAYAEIVGFIERSDLDTTATIATLTNLPITSPALQRILGLIEQRTYDPNFPVRLVAKDLRYLTEATTDLPMMTAAAHVFAAGASGVQRDLDIAGIAQRYQPS